MFYINYILFLFVVLFFIGLFGVLLKKNLFSILLSLEIMINSASISFVVVGSYLNLLEGHIIYIFSITMLAIESVIGLILMLKYYQINGSLDIS